MVLRPSGRLDYLNMQLEGQLLIYLTLRLTIVESLLYLRIRFLLFNIVKTRHPPHLPSPHVPIHVHYHMMAQLALKISSLHLPATVASLK